MQGFVGVYIFYKNISYVWFFLKYLCYFFLCLQKNLEWEKVLRVRRYGKIMKNGMFEVRFVYDNQEQIYNLVVCIGFIEELFY